jgi:hypothetical protein
MDGLEACLYTGITESEFPGAEHQAVPWWWDTSEFESAPGNYAKATGMRSRVTRLAHGGESYRVRVVDHGQRVGFAGDAERVVETARNGVTRIGTHSRFGFGELRVRPPDAARVPARDAASARTDSGGVSE